MTDTRFLYQHIQGTRAEAAPFTVSLDLMRPYPAWFMMTLASGMVQYNRSLDRWRLIQQSPVNREVLVETVNDGDWFVRIEYESHVEIIVYSNTAFHEFWEKVEN